MPRVFSPARVATAIGGALALGLATLAVPAALPTAAAASLNVSADPGSLGAIPDGSFSGAEVCGPTLAVSFTVAGAAAGDWLSDVSVSLTATHERAGDVIASLVAPSGHTRMLFGRPGRTNDSASTEDELDGTYVFSDDAPASPTFWEAAAGAGSVVPPGTYRASSTGGDHNTGGTTLPLTLGFLGATINGVWTLAVRDCAQIDVGTVTAASLSLTTQSGVTGVAVTPGSPANDNDPVVTGTAPAGSTVSVYGNASCSGTPMATGTAAQLATGLPIHVADNSTTGVRVVAEVANGRSPCPDPVTYVEDSSGPSVTVNQAAGQADPTNVASVEYDVVFSEPVTGFDASDVSLVDSTAAGALVANVAGSGTTYTVTVTGMTGPGDVVATVLADAAADAAANLSAASTSTDNRVAFDNVGPTVTIDQAPGQPDPTDTLPIEFRVVFDEAVTGFDENDVSLAGSTAPGAIVSAVTGSGTTYTVTVDGLTGSGDVVATVLANAVTDGLGNPSSASTSTDNVVTYNAPPPPRSRTTTHLTVGPESLTAEVRTTNGTTPTGTVTFSVDGRTVGSAPLAPAAGGAMVATLRHVVPTGADRTVRAVYAGDRYNLGSSAELVRTDPRAVARVTSAKPKKRGWYRAPVRVTFTCTPGSGAISCPAPVLLRGNGRGQQVTRTVTADDGGAATVTVTGLHLDRTKPEVRAKGVRNGATYDAPRRVRCQATDDLSGVHVCKVRVKRFTQADGDVTVRYRVVAVDKAGNRKAVRGRYVIDR